MSRMTRRELLMRLMGCAAAAATGTVVVAQSVPADAKEPAESTESAEQPKTDPEERADQLAEKLPEPTEDTEATTFVNRAFRNAGGGFRNAGFRNAGFRNAGFRNGGFANGGFRNAGFRNR